MTARAFAVMVLQWMLIVCCILGVAAAVERLFSRPRRKRNMYVEYDQVTARRRQIERRGFNSKQGIR